MPRRTLVGNPVLLTLALASGAAALGLAFLTQAPNRLVSGHGIALGTVLTGAWWALLLPAGALLVGGWLRPARTTQWAMLGAACALMMGLVALAGAQARQFSAAAEAAGGSLGRTSFGGGFWVLVMACGLAAADALQRLGLSASLRTLALGVMLAPFVGLIGSGALDALSLFKEYANRQDVFQDALQRHGLLVIATLLPSVLIGVPLGLWAHRHPRAGGPLLAALNLVQTVPSVALFGLLMAPLAALATAWPALGIAGVGMAPAITALCLYALLPIVRSTLAGLQAVPAEVLQAARGMGLSAVQVFWRVQVPLAWPLLLSGLRLTTVQTIGLAVVAALIGAGGFGALVFQGLLSSALDLVLLGVLPVVALAAVVDAGFGLVTPRRPGAEATARAWP